MNRDIIAFIALKCGIETIRKLILVNKRFCKILNCKEFVQNKIEYEFPGIKREWRSKEFYFELKKQIRSSPFLPIIKWRIIILFCMKCFDVAFTKTFV